MPDYPERFSDTVAPLLHHIEAYRRQRITIRRILITQRLMDRLKPSPPLDWKPEFPITEQERLSWGPSLPGDHGALFGHPFEVIANQPDFTIEIVEGGDDAAAT